MELLEKFIELLQEENRKCYEISKSCSVKAERPRFRNYMGAYTTAIVMAKKLLKDSKKE